MTYTYTITEELSCIIRKNNTDKNKVKRGHKIITKKSKNNTTVFVYGSNCRYILNEKKSSPLKKKKLSYNNSYENLKLLINDNNTENKLFSNKIIKFGKYKNKTYEYVYNIDKLYCYHLAYWKDNNLNNSTLLNKKNITNYI